MTNKEEKRGMLDVGNHVKWLAALTGGSFILTMLFGGIASLSSNESFAEVFFGMGAILLGIGTLILGVASVGQLIEDMKDSSRGRW